MSFDLVPASIHIHAGSDDVAQSLVLLGQGTKRQVSLGNCTQLLVTARDAL
jgi:hypothetical protein